MRSGLGFGIRFGKRKDKGLQAGVRWLKGVGVAGLAAVSFSLLGSGHVFAQAAPVVEKGQPGEVVPFVLKTLDGSTQLQGELDLPVGSQGKLPLVVMVAGTGLFDRDVHFGAPDDPRSLFFKNLSQQLNQRGVATLRYDYRGVCHQAALPACPDCQTPAQHSAYFVSHCFQNPVRQGVTPANIRSDLLQVYDWGLRQPQVDPSRVVVLAHSEGSLHTAWLMKEKAIAPKGAVLIGGIYESPASVVNWQMVERMQTAIMQADSNSDGQVSKEELTAYQPQHDLLAMVPPAQLAPPDGGWTAEKLRTLLSTQYSAEKKRIQGLADTAPFSAGQVTQASTAWWKMFFTESPTVASWFHASGLPVVNHLGDRDSQIQLARQQAALKALPSNNKLQIVIHPGQGHALGKHMLMGPMSEASEARLLDSILEQLGS